MKRFRASEKDVGKRADVFVAQRMPRFTRSSLGAIFDRGLVKVSGKASKASHKIRKEENISVDDSLLKLTSETIDLPIIYEDDDVVVINKPAGVLTHSKGALNLEPTVASFLKQHLTDEKLTGNRAGIVHRLDRATSGVIIGAKNAKSLLWLQRQFSARKTGKTYLAIVEGHPEPLTALIDAPIGRNPKRPQSFKVSSAGKAAQTEYRVQKTFEKEGRSFSLVKLAPITGRTHQLRVHLAYIGHPVVGDSLYGHLNNQQLLLHAAELSVTLPKQSKKVFKSPLPDYFQNFMR